MRDLLHVDDLVDLIDEQLGDHIHWDGAVANVGGGREVSLSLARRPPSAQRSPGAAFLEVTASGGPRPGDIPVYISDCSKLFELTSWRPAHDARSVLADIHTWVLDNETAIAAAL